MFGRWEIFCFYDAKTTHAQPRSCDLFDSHKHAECTAKTECWIQISKSVLHYASLTCSYGH